MKIPLSEMMKLLGETKEHMPSIKAMPNRISDIELDIYSLKEQLRSKFVTFHQLQTTNDTFRKDLELLMDHTTQQTIARVIQTIEDKVPFEYLDGIMKHKASLDTLKVSPCIEYLVIGR